MTAPSPQPPTNLGEGRSMKRDVSRRGQLRATSSRGEDGKPNGPLAGPATMGPPRHRTAEDERARAAAKQAEKEMWEKTRGAGSSVFKLAEAGRIKRRRNSSDGVEGGEGGEWTAEDVLPALDEVENKQYEIVDVPSIDVLLSRGICDYTLLPKTLGRGKFSTVFMASKSGELSAIKHTALFPHHQLISTRLLREPTLLAELPPHPNLVAVKETIRTPGHFYLIEEYLGGYVTLEALIPLLSESQPPVLPIAAAEKILSQLLSAVHAIHVPLQICHRDIKPENILVHPDTLQLKLLDFGLATHYSKSEPKLSTCCGSPAFHCPEIVKALASPPGSVTYMGPEVDAWTCGVTMLRCLIGQRFPLGASHSSMRGMAIRAQRAVASIADEGMRIKVGALLDMDGAKRMKRFEELVAEQEKVLGEPAREQKKFKSTTFIPVEPTHSIKLPIIAAHLTEEVSTSVTPGFVTPSKTNSASRRTTPSSSRHPSPTRSQSSTPSLSHGDGQSLSSNTIIALNPTHQPPERVLSFIKYCLRCAGILYHTWPDSSGIKEGPAGSPTTYFSGQPSHSQATTQTSNAAFAEAIGLGVETGSSTSSLQGNSPFTPLVGSFSEVEERTDGYGHVQVFQCVMEVSESQEHDDAAAEQLTLVQSIMAAFGRKKPAAAPPLSSPRPDNKRSLSTPAKARAREAALAPGTPMTSTARPSSSTAAKDGKVQCLTFHMVVRFPKSNGSVTTHAATGQGSARMGPSRNPSSMSLGQQAATNNFTAHGGRHSRANSGAALAFPTLDIPLVEEQPGAAEEAVASEGRIDGKQSGKHISFNAQQEHLRPKPDGHNLEINTDLGQTAATRSHRSPSSSRAPSRTRKRSHRGSQRRAKIIIRISDSRATQTIRDALSVGGTIDSLEESDYFSTHHRHSHHFHRGTNIVDTAPEVGTPLARRSDSRTPSRPDEQRASRARSSTSIGRVTDSRSSTPRASDDLSLATPRSRSRHDGDEERRGRQMGDVINRGTQSSKSGGARAPSQLSSLALQEESPNGETFKQTIESLAATLELLTTATPSPADTPLVTVTSSDALSPTCRGSEAASSSNSSSSTSLPSMTAYTGGETAPQTRVRMLLTDVSRRLHQAEKSGPSALEDLISPLSFALFAALSPALGLEPQETKGLPVGGTLAPTTVGEAVTLRGHSLSALTTLAASASPREMFIAAQERLEMISTTKPSSKEANEAASTDSAGVSGSLPTASSETWSGGLETAGILHFLSLVVPRIQTQKPVNFVQPLTALVPRAIHSSLRRPQPANEEEQDTAWGEMSSRASNSNPHTPSAESASTNAPVTDRLQAAADEVAFSLSRLMRSFLAWAEKAEDKEEKAAKTQWERLFFASFIALMPQLSKTGGSVSLSQSHFARYYPQYSWQHPNETHSSDKADTLGKKSDSWDCIGGLVSTLGLDLEAYAFQKSQGGSGSTAEISSAVAIVTMGAFILHVNLLSRASDLSVDQWSVTEALQKLKKALPILLASLGSGPPATISIDGQHSLGGAANLADAALCWTFWCVQAFNRGESSSGLILDEPEALMLVQMLSSHAALSPDAMSRLIGITLVESILQCNIAPQLGRELLRDLIVDSPFPQLKSASIGLAKRLVAADLESHSSDRFASRPMLDAISATVFQLPSAFSEGDKEDTAFVKSLLDDHSAWLSECLSFLYFVASRDEQNQTGILDEASKVSIQSNLIRPLEQLISCVDRMPQITKEDMDTALQSSLISVGLDRVKEALMRAV